MNDGWRYRLGAVFGAAGIAALAVLVASLDAVQAAFGVLPVVGQISLVTLPTDEGVHDARIALDANRHVDGVAVGTTAPQAAQASVVGCDISVRPQATELYRNGRMGGFRS